MPSLAQAVSGWTRRKPTSARNNPLHSLARGKVLHYPFLSLGGTVLYDVVSGLAATWQPRTGSAPFQVATTAGGLFGRCLNMRGGVNPGQNSGLAVANSSLYKPTAALSVTAWVNPDGLNNNYNQVCGLDYRNNGTWSAPFFAYGLGSGSGSVLTPNFQATFSGTQTTAMSPSAIPTNTWTHLAGTYDGSLVRIYVNGQQVASSARSGTIDYGTSAGLEIGNVTTLTTLPTTSQYLSAYLDDFRVYNRGLSQAEILWLMREPFADLSTPPPIRFLLNPTAVPAIPVNIRVKRGSNPTTTLADGEPGWNRTTRTLYVGDTGANYPAVPTPAVNPSLCQGRLSLSSTLAVPTSDLTSAATVYLLPYNGTGIALYTGSAWTQYTIVGAPSLSLGAAAAGVYDVYLDWSSGSPVLNFLAWTSNTARGTALIQQDGVYCVGINTRRYLGTIYLQATGLTQDTLAARQVWNYYNRVARPLARQEYSGTASWTYNTNAWRVANQTTSGTNNNVQVVAGVAEDAMQLQLATYSLTTIAGGAVYIAAGEDSTTTPFTGPGASGGVQGDPSANNGQNAFYNLNRLVPIGLHTYYWLENQFGSGTRTWYSSSAGITMGLTGSFKG